MSYIGEEVGVYAPAPGIVHWGFEIPGVPKEEVEFGSDDVLGFVKADDGEEWDILPTALDMPEVWFTGPYTTREMKLV